MTAGGAPITDEHIAHYREHGYAIVEGFLGPDLLAGAHAEIEQVLPGWLGYCADPSRPKPDGWDAPSVRPRADRRQFPFPGRHLNAITLHPELRRLAVEMVGHDDLFCEQSNLLAKCKGAVADADQVMHCDYSNHTLAYPPNVPAYWQVAYLLYYTDVTEQHAPTAVCSRRHYPERILWPSSYSRDDRPALYDNEVKVTVPAGSLLAYSMRTFHRGTPFLGDVGRVVQFVTYAPAACRWLGIVGWPAQATRPEFRDWVESATTAERELLGFPPPGHDYWTAETLDGVAARYPAMDMAPYRAGGAD